MAVRIVYLLTGLFICLVSGAQNIRVPVNPLYTKIFTYSKALNNAIAYAGNPAALAGIQNLSVGVFSEKRFMLNELGQYHLALATPSGLGNFGVSLDYFGSNLYNETGAGIAYAKRLGSKVDVGIQFNYYSVQMAGFNRAAAINANVGILVHITENLRTGLQVSNPTGAKLGKSGEEKLPAIFYLGLGYDLSDKLLMTATFEKVENKPANIIAGLHYSFDEKLFANAGVTSSSAGYFLGMGVQLNSFQLIATATLHQQLGFTPGLMLLFTKKKPGE